MILNGITGDSKISKIDPESGKTHHFWKETGDFVHRSWFLSEILGKSPGSRLRHTAVIGMKHGRPVGDFGVQ